MERIFCLIIGYLLGNFLTAVLITNSRIGRDVKTIGSGNPGVANVTASLGLKWGIAVLAGDLFKTMTACILCRYIFSPELGELAVLYAGIGVILGHDYPFWNHFNGGKGVTATCMVLFLADPWMGIFASLFGLLAVILTHSLTIGALVIPLVYIVPAFMNSGFEAGIIAIAICLLMFMRNWTDFKLFLFGKGKKTDLLKFLKKKA